MYSLLADVLVVCAPTLAAKKKLKVDDGTVRRI